MANLPQSSQSDSMDSLTVTREQFRLHKKDELEFLAQALGNVSGSYTTETVSPTAVVLQGTPTLAAGAEPAAADSSLRLVNTRWVKQNAASTGTTAPTTPVRGQVWIDTSQDPPVMNVWDDTPAPGAWVPVSGVWQRTGTTISQATNGDKLVLKDGTGAVSVDLDAGASASPLVRDSSGRLGIGTTSATEKLTVDGGICARHTSDDSQIKLSHNGTIASISATYGSTGAYDPLAFFTSDQERARIDTSGRLLVGTSSSSAIPGLLCKDEATGVKLDH